jgi:hypothetical protein
MMLLGITGAVSLSLSEAFARFRVHLRPAPDTPEPYPAPRTGNRAADDTGRAHAGRSLLFPRRESIQRKKPRLATGLPSSTPAGRPDSPLGHPVNL